MHPIALPLLLLAVAAVPAQTSIDAFVQRELDAAGLAPAPPASDRVLVRRAYYDLIGLPPSPAQVEAFVADDAGDKWERLIEGLLRSPRYGEKWGRHWLDVVRYAETNGYERDSDKPFIWRYRDYVIDAFNDDLPYDRFILEQLAGDELGSVTPRSLTATGYYRLGVWDDEPPMGALRARYDVLDDIVSTTGQVFLGLTLGCARCHDHKKDPIPQTDYYRFMAFFHGITDMSKDGFLCDIMSAAERAEYDRAVAARDREEAEVDTAIFAFEQRFIAGLRAHDASVAADAAGAKRQQIPRLIEQRGAEVLTAAELDAWAGLQRRRREIHERRIPHKQAAAVQEGGPTVADLHVHRRGNPEALGAKVEPGFPTCLQAEPAVVPPAPPGAASSGRRRVLAEWIASAANPRTAQVMVNRLWQHHFGHGIVRTSNDFGGFGSGASHPALLDWLAGQFVASGWSIKALHRLMMTSATYRRSSAISPRAHQLDPTDDLFGRFEMRRLTAEEMRDSVLWLTGKLNLQMHGPSVFAPMPKAQLATSSRPDEAWGTSPDEQTYRRSIYVKVKRSLLTPILANFDFADTDASCPERFTTTLPTQALGMLNGDFANRHARDFAERLRREAGDRADAQVRLALRLALGREPHSDEVASHVHFLTAMRDELGASTGEALRNFCLMVFSLNEFAHVE